MLEPKIFLMVCDGLRPDSIDAQRTPNLAALAQRGVDFRRSHAVFPTVTRANSSSLATGVYPHLHGIAGNELLALPGGSENYNVHDGKPFSTADADRLHELRPARDGHILLSPTLADRIHAAGGRTAVVGTGSTGAALLQNPQVEADEPARTDLLLHPRRFVGLSQETVEATHGPVPPRAAPNTDQNAYFTTLITDLLLPAAQHDLIVFWHTDPDHSQHTHGLGHPLAHQAIADADTNLGRILDAIEQQPEPWLIAVTSDHGFSTITPVLGDTDIAAALGAAGLKDSPTSDDVVPVDGGIYLRDAAIDRGPAIIDLLQRLPGIGPLFTGGGPTGDADDAPVLDGTMSRALIRGSGDLAPDIQLSVHWSAAENARGTAGLCAGPKGRLAGTHGSLSPFEVRNTLIMTGPGIRPGPSEIPAAIVDVAPTLAHLSGLAWDGPSDGRILHEALIDGPHPSELEVLSETIRLATPHGEQILERSTVLDHTYVDWGAVVRA